MGGNSNLGTRTNLPLFRKLPLEVLGPRGFLKKLAHQDFDQYLEAFPLRKEENWLGGGVLRKEEGKLGRRCLRESFPRFGTKGRGRFLLGYLRKEGWFTQKGGQKFAGKAL